MDIDEMYRLRAQVPRRPPEVRDEQEARDRAARREAVRTARLCRLAWAVLRSREGRMRVLTVSPPRRRRRSHRRRPGHRRVVSARGPPEDDPEPVAGAVWRRLEVLAATIRFLLRYAPGASA